MKVSELEGAALDYWVARALGILSIEKHAMVCQVPFIVEGDGGDIFSPSSIWGHGGPIIERKFISIQTIMNVQTGVVTWQAMMPVGWYGDGATPLIAAMRCFVASKYGDEVPDA